MTSTNLVLLLTLSLLLGANTVVKGADNIELYNSYGAANCINHPDTSELDISVEEHEIYRASRLNYAQDPVDYWWRYDIFFHTLGVNCSISGTELKVYIHSDDGGLGIDGAVSRWKHAGERWSEWTNEDEDLTDAGQQFPDPYPDEPTCEVFLSQAGQHRASSGTLYEYGVNRYCHVDVTFRADECIVPELTSIDFDGQPVYTTAPCEDKWSRHVVVYSTDRLLEQVERALDLAEGSARL